MILLLLCVDDCLLFCEDNEELTRTIKAMQEKFALSEQDIGQDVFGYLGIELTMEGTRVTMHQNGWMNKIFENTRWTELTGCATLAKQKPLGADLDGEPFKADWDHSSGIGELMFLVNTRPDAQFAVH